MPEPVAVDTTMLSALMDRLTRTADELAAIEIPGIEGLSGSALNSLVTPGHVTAEVRRLGTEVRSWVCSLRRSVDELAAADNLTAERLRQR